MAHAIVHAGHDPRPPRGAVGLERVHVGDPQQRLVLVGGPEFEGELTGTQQSPAGVDHPRFLAPLAARTVGDDADDVDALGQRDVQEFVLAVHRLLLGALEDVVHIEFDVVADRQFAAQIDAIEHIGLVEGHGGHREAAAADASGADRKTRREHIADGDVAGVQRTQQVAFERPLLQEDAAGDQLAGVVGPQIGLKAGVEQVAAKADIVLRLALGRGRLGAKSEGDVERRRREELVRRVDAHDRRGRAPGPALAQAREAL